jgi:hypothetical protein
MKIEDKGYVITDVPGQEYIEIRPAKTAGEVVVEIKDEAAEYPRSWELDTLQEYMEALGRAIQLGRNIEAQNIRVIKP